MKFKSKFKLELDIETNAENMQKVLEVITCNITKELIEKVKDKTEVICSSKITKIEI